jgi:hypothetical protein
MNAGMAIFLIVVLLVGSFMGLGYLFNQSMNQVDEISALKKQLLDTQAALDSAEKTHETDQNRIQELEGQVNILEEKIAEVNKIAATPTKNCNIGEFTPPQNLQSSYGSFGNWLFVSSLAFLIIGSVIYRIYILKKNGRDDRPIQSERIITTYQTAQLSAKEKVVNIPMTYMQLQRYINYQRNSK